MQLLDQMQAAGTIIKLNEALRPGCYAARSPPGDVARVEARTFICSERKEDAGPSNNWVAPEEMKATLSKIFDGCMAGRTMHAVPFCMGPLGSPLAEYGVQLTDSPNVVANLRIMTRMGKGALEHMGKGDNAFVPCLHSVGHPLGPHDSDVAWPMAKDGQKYIAHFPESREIISYGSGYGGNAILPKKCFALRIASVMARDAGWLAEHMLIVGITAPDGRKKYMAAAFPSACGKTNLAMLTLPPAYAQAGWKVTTVGDDIAWMRWNPNDGTLRAINPEFGMFGVAPGTNAKSNPNALAAVQKNSLFTNVAVTPDGDVWWEGLSKEAPAGLVDWKRREWVPPGAPGATGDEAAHPNSRFTAPASQVPCIDAAWQDPAGVPISAIIFGGRRSDTMPLCYETLSWEAGVYAGASMHSEQTAAAEGARGVLRSDPMAMKPFCGYNMAQYWGHWLSMDPAAPAPSGSPTGERSPSPPATPGGAANRKLPGIYFVNWFRKDANGKFLWPGFGENARVLEWIFDRCDARERGKAAAGPAAVETAVGYVPDATQGKAGLNLAGTGVENDKAALDALLSIEPKAWKAELARNEALFAQFDAKDLPPRLLAVHEKLKARLQAAEAGKPFSHL